jgi:hypothetical protein
VVSNGGKHGTSGMSKSTAWPRDYYPLVFAILMREDEVADISQFDARQKRYLELAVKKGDLSKHKAAGPYPKAKTCYSCPKFDFESARREHLETMRKLAQLDARGRKVRSLPTSRRN